MPNPPAGAALVGFWSAGAVLALAGIQVLLADPRSRWNLWLVAFLGLEAATFGFVGAIYLGSLLGSAGWMEAAGSLAAILSLFAAGALVVFASVFPRRRAGANRWTGALLLVAAPAILASVEVTTRGVSAAASNLAWPALAQAAFVAGCFVWASHLLTRSHQEAGDGIMGRQVAVVTAGVLVAALPWAAELGTRVAMDLAALASPSASLAVEIATWPVLLWLGYAAFAPRLDREGSPGGESTAPRRWVLGAFVAFTALWAGAMLPRGLDLAGLASPPWATSVADATILWMLMGRWVVLGAALLLAFQRFGAFGVDGAAWRRSVAGVLGLGAVGFVGAASLTLGAWAAGGVAGLLVAGAVAAVTTGAPLDPGPDLQQRGREAYRKLLAEALASGEAPDGDDIERKRRRLGISRREHEFLLALARADAEVEAGSTELAGRYEIRERLGAGSFGTAYRVRDRERGEDLVLKRFREPLEDGLPDEAVARNVSHGNLVTVHGTVELDRGPALLMEHVPGGSLRDRLEEEGPLPSQEVLRILRQTLEGLRALHDRGIAHGDVKPSNILLDEDGDVRLADFGLATSAGRDIGRTLGPGQGTPRYLPPDRRDRDRPGPDDDLYAAGVVALELLVGDPDVPVDEAGLGPGWRVFLETALAEVPEERYRDAEAMIEALPEDRIQGRVLAEGRR